MQQQLLLKTGEKEKLQINVSLADSVAAPVDEKQILGELIISLGGKTIAAYPLYAEKSVRALTLSDVILRLFSSLRVRSS